jgi:hypothetical protein
LSGDRGKLDDFGPSNSLTLTAVLAGAHHRSGHRYRPVAGDLIILF